MYGLKISAILAFCLFMGVGHSEEVINHFHSDVVIAKNAEITVTESITVTAENIMINRGIYRDFPTQYLGTMMTKKQVGFKVLKVTRNDQPEPFHTEQLSNGIRVYIGSSNKFLSKGQHHYQLTYQTNNQLGFFDQYDEFYWNVTGNGWQFPILSASISIQLPDQGHQQLLDQRAWTGYQGEQHQNYEIINSQHLLGFKTTQALNPYQGLTIGIQIRKGIFHQPSFDLAGFLAANLVWLFALIMILFYLGFYFSAWFRYGRDPEKDIIMARFYPPDGLSAAAVHYIESESVSDKTLTACLLSLAVKGHITITQLTNKYQISKQTKAKKLKLSKGESALKSQLFSGKRTKVTLSKKPNYYLRAAKTKLNSTLNKEYKKKCFVDNSFYMIWGWVISAVCLFMVTLVIYQAYINVTDLIILIFSSIIFLSILAAFIISAPILVGLLMLITLATSYLDLFHFLMDHKVWILFTVFLVCLNLLFSYLLKAPTPFGRHIKDQIDGLKLYIKSAEEDRLNLMNPPDKSIEYYESLLPYAVALGLENQWADKFSDVINTEHVTATKTTTSSYQPIWYQVSDDSASSFNFSVSNISQSLKKSVAYATVIPSASGSSSSSSYSSSSYSSSSSSSSYSSSSSSGSSGGGGGGGGGGGW